MKFFSLKLITAAVVLIGISSCDKGKMCECTTAYSNGDPESSTSYPNIDKTSEPDCSSYVGTVDAPTDGTATTTCIIVDQP